MQGDKSADGEKILAGDTELRQSGDEPESESNLPQSSSANVSGRDFAEATRPSITSIQDLSEFTHASEPSLVGELIEQYRIVQVLGKGGMSVVYKAVHSILQNTVAIKTMHAHLVSEAQAVMRFKQEAQAATQLDHPNVIKVTGFGITSGEKPQPYIIMDYIEGRSLSEVLKQNGRLPVPNVLKIFIQACNALSHAHNKGIIHRDLKPSNIMLLEKDGDPDFVKIVDFGIAKLLTQEGEQAHRLTQTGDVFGSPLYMSPEQCMGRVVDKRSDVYALGCVLYEALGGKPPHQGNNVFETFHKHISEIPATLIIPEAEKALVDRLDAIVFRALEKDPDKRYQSMSQFESDLRAVQENLDSGMRGTSIRHGLARQQRSLLRFMRSAPKAALVLGFLAIVLSASGCLFWSKCSWFFETHADLATPQTRWLSYLPPRYDKRHVSESKKQAILDRELDGLDLGRLRHPADSPYMLRMWEERAKNCAELDAPAEEIKARKRIIEDFYWEPNSKTDPNYGVAAEELAECLISQGSKEDLEAALPLLKDAVFIREKHSSNFTQKRSPRVNLDLAFVFCKLNKFADAEIELVDAIKYLNTGNNESDLNVSDARQLAIVYAVQGDVFRLQGKWMQAELSYAKAGQLIKASKYKKAAAFVNELALARAFVNLKDGQFREASMLYDLAMPYVLEHYKNQNDQLQLVLNDYASAAWANHDFMKAIKLREQAAELLSTSASP